MSIYNELTNLYPVQKTLKFELCPIGNTLEHFLTSGILEEDEQRHEEYKSVKKIIDRYHKQFIEKALSNFSFKVQNEEKLNSLEEYIELFIHKKSEENGAEKFKKVQDNLRKQITSHFAKQEAFANLFKKELIQDDLPAFVTSTDEKEMIAHFTRFTTYFVDFHKNRKNMYSDEAKATSIAYRLIHENLPKFLTNALAFERIRNSEVANHFEAIQESLNIENIASLFDPLSYSQVLTQAKIDIYNGVIGGKTLDNLGNRSQGLNEYINLYNQTHNERLPLLKPLYKQILSDRSSLSWLPDTFKDDEQLADTLNDWYNEIENEIISPQDGQISLRELLENISTYNIDTIYIQNDTSITDISTRLFKRYDTITNAVSYEFQRILPRKKNESQEKYDERIKKIIDKKSSFSIGYLNYCLSQVPNLSYRTIDSYFKSLGAYERDGVQKENLLTSIERAHFLAQPYIINAKGDNLIHNSEAIKAIRELLVSVNNLLHFIKPLCIGEEEADADASFYGDFTHIWAILEKTTLLYNMVRNYLTRKPYSTDKFKLNFKNDQLLLGWDQNKEVDRTTVLLRKDGYYYLAIMNKAHNRIFDMEHLPDDGDCYEKMDYKLLPGPNKMLPKVFFSKSRIDEFAPDTTLLENYNKGTHKKGNNFRIEDCHALIDFFKASIDKHEDWKKFGFHFSDTKDYEDLSDFYQEVEKQGYKVSFRNVSVSYIDNLVNEGKLYLFKIYNKDFSSNSKGIPNLHTLYWKMLFDERNLKHVVYKLNGEAEIFYRKASIPEDKRIIHHVNDEKCFRSPWNQQRHEVFKHEIIQDRRYTIDKFQFHVPITINFQSKGIGDINEKVQQLIHDGKIRHIIGLDRGERHLLYLSLIDMKGNIVKQISLNEIANQYNGNIYKTHYQNLLKQREKDRLEARKNWQVINNIKNLKQGYLSQVVHKISEMIVEYDAIVVLEDLNFGFMRGRQKIERSIYQQFEVALIEKLNYLVDKKQSVEKECGLLQALQLTNQFESFQKLGKQTGVLFYIPAWNTSKIDPVTGFTNLFDTRCDTREKIHDFISSFDSIKYNPDKNYFEFSFNYNNFTKKAEGSRTHWTICSYGERIETFYNPEKNNNWDMRVIDLSAQIRSLLEEEKIDINGNLKDAILRIDKPSFLKSIMHYIKLMLQMRNSKTGTEEDYILSPVADENGIFFDSRTQKTNLPLDADANGAYNIARKGLWIVRQIQKKHENEKLNLAISNKEWLKFAQEKTYLND